MTVKKNLACALMFASISAAACANPTLAERARTQLKTLDLTLEDIGLAVNAKVAQVADRKVVAAHIFKLREILGRTLYNTNASFVQLLAAEKGMLEYLESAANDGFDSLQDFNEYAITIQPVEVMAPQEMTELLDNYEARIKALNKYIKHIGTNFLHRIGRDFAWVDKKTKFSKLVKRSLPYFGVGAYIVLTTDKAKLPQWTWLGKVKDFLGTDIRKKTEQPEAATNPTGIADKIHDSLGSAVTFMTGNEKANTIFTMTAGVLMAPVIKKDWADLTDWLGHLVGKTKNWFQGKPYEDGKPFKLSKTKMNDVIGTPEAKKEITRIVDYVKAKTGLDRSGVLTDRGYLLVGPLDSSKTLAQAAAGEVTEHFKAKGKSTVCYIYEIHSSELIKKEDRLKDLIKEAADYEPCIILIEDLGWLASQKRVDAKVWSDLASTLNGVLKGKKKIFVIATVTDLALIPDHYRGHMGVTVPVNEPTVEDRAAFLVKELSTKRGIPTDRLDIQWVARETAGYTFVQLTAVINRALTLAQTSRQTLDQKHLVEAVAASKIKVA